ncbi:MAG: HD-GYP domain-containing protein [Zoogloeaceae bacterium]|jgi:HD-GYP domain-containing protein (c-di-GMP phosphodiesterase class II)|nr:HD-GYP domain-containing protein [Zoogloeaceae bacterium]
MIKKISVGDLIPGMFVHDLNCGWMDHPFLTNSFMVDGKARIAKIRSLGVQDLYIDTDRGLDLPYAQTEEEVAEDLQQRMENIAGTKSEKSYQAEVREEAPRARKLHNEANGIVKRLMDDVRMGAQIEIERMAPLVEDMIDSIFRNQSALLPLTALKRHDTYTFEHSVSVCALMVAFARGLEMSRQTIRDIAMGALLHDVGKARIPDAILNKPSRLTEAEFIKMKDHVQQSILILQQTPGLVPAAMQVAAQHHERYDGSGYPKKLRGDGLSIYGKMASIVDVYDAISSDRVYHKGLQPSQALKKLLEWSSHHFEPRLVHSFIRAIGIYPTGSLIRLESGRLAVVYEQNEGDLLHPVVTVIYNARKMQYLPPLRIDLAQTLDRVVGHEDFSRWKIDPKPWQPA